MNGPVVVWMFRPGWLATTQVIAHLAPSLPTFRRPTPPAIAPRTSKLEADPEDDTVADQQGLGRSFVPVLRAQCHARRDHGHGHNPNRTAELGDCVEDRARQGLGVFREGICDNNVSNREDDCAALAASTPEGSWEKGGLELFLTVRTQGSEEH